MSDPQQTSVDVLKSARELLSDPNHWTEGAFARDKTGDVALPMSASATCWCTMGAIDKTLSKTVTRVRNHPAHIGALYLLERAMQVTAPPAIDSVIGYNDHLFETKNHAELMAWFDRAIAL